MKPTVAFEDFEKLDVRVGKIISASVPEWSQKLIVYRVDFGPEIGEKTILSGIKAWYGPEDLVGKSYPFIINLVERKMGKSISQGMMLMVVPDSEKPVLIEIDASVQLGTIVR